MLVEIQSYMMNMYGHKENLGKVIFQENELQD